MTIRGNKSKLNYASSDIQNFVVELYADGSSYSEIADRLWHEKNYKISSSSIQRWLRLQEGFKPRTPPVVSVPIPEKAQAEPIEVDFEIGDFFTECEWMQSQFPILIRLSVEALKRGLISHLEQHNKYPTEASKGLQALFHISSELSKTRNMRNLIDFESGLGLPESDLLRWKIEKGLIEFD